MEQKSQVKANSLTPQQLNDLKETFSLFDKDRDGTMSSKELGMLVRSLGHTPTEAELQKMIDEVDKDGNGSLELEEFLTLMSKHESKDPKENAEELKEAFRIFDKDGNGWISKKELGEVLKEMGEPLTDEDVEELMNDFDKDGDGQLDLDEFCKMLATTEV